MTAPRLRVDLRAIEARLKEIVAVHTFPTPACAVLSKDLAACLAALREAQKALRMQAQEAAYKSGEEFNSVVWRKYLVPEARNWLASITDGEPGPAKEGE